VNEYCAYCSCKRGVFVAKLNICVVTYFGFRYYCKSLLSFRHGRPYAFCNVVWMNSTLLTLVSSDLTSVKFGVDLHSQ
jgi:hypothetical protein